jgi:hypothetical protein
MATKTCSKVFDSEKENQCLLTTSETVPKVLAQHVIG